MQDMQIYTLNEIIGLAAALIIGSATYVGFVWKKKPEEITLRFVVSVLCINFLPTLLSSELIKILKYPEYRMIAMLMASFAGQYLVEWFSNRYPQIFDAGLKKAGLEINKTEKEEDNENTQEDHQ